VAAGGGFGEVSATELVVDTDGSVPTARGYPTLSLVSLEAGGFARNDHQPDDRPEALDMATVVRAADFGAAAVHAVLRGESGPIAIL
jgi:Iap family predicted aminopeptidase